MLFEHTLSLLTAVISDTPAAHAPLLSTGGLEKSYPVGAGQTYVLRRIALSIEPGEFVSIMGPSGAASPSVILADEPTGNLHSSQGRDIMELFKRLNEQGTTIVQVTHWETNAAYGSRVITLRDGLMER